MSADYIVRESRAVLISLDNLAVRDKAELYQCLEAVADTAHKAVPVFEQVHNCCRYLGISEERGDKFCRTFGLVTAGETSGDEDNLRVIYLGSESFN